MSQVTALERSVALPRGVRGAADPHFRAAVRAFAAMFPHRRLGGGALSVYLHGEPVVDVWTGWSDRQGHNRWSADTGAMVFSATKGVASTVIHRLHDRGLIDYEAPVAEYWPEFAANGKAGITVRDMMGHRAGLAHLNGVSKRQLLDHVAMEERMAAAAPSRQLGSPAYHALTYGWLLSGLARSITGQGMRQLIRDEVAGPLGTDGLHLGRPPESAPTRAAQIIHPQARFPNPVVRQVASRAARGSLSAGFGSLYFPGMTAVVRGDTPLLDSEIPAANGVSTARGLARMYGALANGGTVGGTRLLSEPVTRGLIGKRSLRPDGSLVIPMAFHLGYHAIPVPGVLPGFGHVGLGGSLGWAVPELGLGIGFVHNRLLTPLVVTDHAGFVATSALIRRGAAGAHRDGYAPVQTFGSGFRPTAGAVRERICAAD